MHTTIYSSTGTVLKWSNNTATLKLILSAIIFPQYWYTVAMCAYIYICITLAHVSLKERPKPKISEICYSPPSPDPEPLSEKETEGERKKRESK